MDLTEARRVCLDTSAAVYLLDRPRGDTRRAVVEPYVHAAEIGDVTLLASTVVVAELLTKPIREANRSAEVAARLLLELCQVVDVTFGVAERASVLRARHGLSTPDAIIWATAIVTEADAVLGNDRRWQRMSDVEFLHIDTLAGRH